MKRSWIVALAAAGGCDLYIPRNDPDARFNDGRPPADALELDGPRDAPWIDGALVDAPPTDGRPPDPTVPTAPTRAHVPTANGGWSDDGPADWSCLAFPRDVPRTESVELSGRVIDWRTRAPLDRHRIQALPSGEVAPLLAEFTSSSGGAEIGTYAATVGPLPSGTRYGFRLTALDDLSEPQGHVLEAYFPPGNPHTRDLEVLSSPTVDALFFAVGLGRNPDDALVVGDAVDCQGRRVSNAMIAVSTVFATLEPAGFDVFNFSASAANLPFAFNQPTRADGRFAVLQLDRDTRWFFQVWGFRDNVELANQQMTKLATVGIRLPANSAATLVLEPSQN